MKRLFWLSLITFLVAKALAAPCGSEEIKGSDFRVSGEYGLAELNGFPEFSNPSNPPKKFLTKTLSGEVQAAVYTDSVALNSLMSLPPNPPVVGPIESYYGTRGGRLRVMVEHLNPIGANGQARVRLLMTNVNASSPGTFEYHAESTLGNGGYWYGPANEEKTLTASMTTRSGPIGSVFNWQVLIGIRTKTPNGVYLDQKTLSGSFVFSALGPVYETLEYSGTSSIDAATGIQNNVGVVSGHLLDTTTGNLMAESGANLGSVGDAISRLDTGCFSGQSDTQTTHSPNETTSVEQIGLSSYYRKITSNTLVDTLSDEDTEAAAIGRTAPASSANPTSVYEPRSSTDTDNDPFTFRFGEVSASADFQLCAGDYVIKYHFKRRLLSGGNWEAWDPRVSPGGYASPPVASEYVTVTTPKQTFIKTLPRPDNPDPYEYTITAITATPAYCSQATAGSGTHKLSSVHSALSLGMLDAIRGAGVLMLDAEEILPATYTPAALAYVGPEAPEVTVIHDASDQLRQIKTPVLLADIVTLDSPDEGFDVRFYHAVDVGSADPVTGIHAVSGTPYVSHRYANPDAGQTVSVARLRVSETRGTVVKTFDYTQDPVTDTWGLAEGDGLRVTESVTTIDGNGDEVVTRTLKTAADEVASVVATTTRNFAWGRETIKVQRDPAGADLTTTYDYYDNPATDGANYRHLKLRVDSTGYWERYTYHADGRVATTTSPWLDSAPTDADSLCKIIAIDHTPLPDADGDELDEPMTTTTESILGQPVSRTYEIEWTAPVTLGGDPFERTTSVRCVDPAAAWNTAGNLTTETLRHADGTFEGRQRRTLRADGTITLVSYSLDTSTGELTTTTLDGQPNATNDGILSGQRTVVVTNDQGHAIAGDYYDVATGGTETLLTSSTATLFDDFGRVLRTDYIDGTHETRSYACCGLDQTRDRTGQITDYGYDALGRQETVTSNGITLKTIYDADDRVRETQRYPADDINAAQTISGADYDLAGRLTDTYDAVERHTTIVETHDPATGQTTTVTTLPHASGATPAETGTITEIRHRDGRLARQTGNATAARRYTYGTATLPEATTLGYPASVRFQTTTEILLNATGSDTTETTTTYADPLGRIAKTAYADDAASYQAYNTLGQLVRQTDPDGVQILHAYNPLGERTVSALDLDRDGTINYGGMDRITRTTRSITTRPGTSVTVRRTTTEAWLTNNTDTPATLTVTDASLDGLTVWQTVNNLTTKTVIAHGPASGDRTETTTYPDLTTQVNTYEGGRLKTTARKDAGGQVVTSFTYDYDAYGRPDTVTDALGRVTTTTYYDDDQIHTITTPDPDTSRSGPGYDAQTTTYTYDATGRVWKVEQPDATITETTYWPNGKVKRVAGGRVYPQAYTYDAQGRVKTLTTWQDYAGETGAATTTWNYHAQRGWLLNKRDNADQGADYDYYPSGRLKTRDWARVLPGTSTRLRTTYTYNNAGELWTITYNDDATANPTPPVTHTYDRAGRPLSTTDAAGLLTRSYDPTSLRLSDETYTSTPGSAGVLAGHSLARTYDALHRPQSLATDAGYALGYDYDTAGRLQTITQGHHAAAFAYETGTSLHNRTTIKRVGVERVRHERTHDRIGRTSGVASVTGGMAAVARDYTYNDANQRTAVTIEDDRRWAYGYDALGQVTSAQKRLADGITPLPGYTFGYTFDDIGNRTQTVTNGESATYTPDPDLLNRYHNRTVPAVLDVRGEAHADTTVTVNTLTTTRTGKDFYRQVDVDNSAASVSTTITIEATRSGPPVESATDNRDGFVAQTPESFTHDDDGNLTQDGRWVYTWDAENRLVAIEIRSDVAQASSLPPQRLEFSYDAQSRRIAKRVFTWNASTSIFTLNSETKFQYDGWNLLTELDALDGNAVLRSHVWGLDLSQTLQGAGGVGGLLWSNTPTHSFAACSDANGNIVAYINTATLAVSGRADYGAFGEVVQRTGVAETLPFGFSSKYLDAETGLNYYGFRYYNPSSGRWVGRDPIGERGGINLYGMVNNNPVGYWDILGLSMPVLTQECLDLYFAIVEKIRKQSGLDDEVNRQQAYLQKQLDFNRKYPNEIGPSAVNFFGDIADIAMAASSSPVADVAGLAKLTIYDTPSNLYTGVGSAINGDYSEASSRLGSMGMGYATTTIKMAELAPAGVFGETAAVASTRVSYLGALGVFGIKLYENFGAYAAEASRRYEDYLRNKNDLARASFAAQANQQGVDRMKRELECKCGRNGVKFQF